jgi:alkylated DNA repair protein (DNA oxidative demethylase)
MHEIIPGLVYAPDYLSREEQHELLADLREAVKTAPLFTPRMPRTGKEFSVRMTNCGALGWVSDRERGYRYQATHPETNAPWPAVPRLAMRAWDALSHCKYPPEACLVNFYDASARMGLHQDRDEQDFEAPVVSLSLGDTCLFRVGGVERKAPTKSFRLNSGDAMMLSGPARLAFHGVDRIMGGTSTLLPQGGRLNLTLRRVNRI